MTLSYNCALLMARPYGLETHHMIALLRFLKPFKLSVVAVVLLLFVQALTELYLPTLMSVMVNEGMLTGNIGAIWEIGGYMLLIAFLSSLCAIGGSYLSARIAIGYSQNLRELVFTKAESFSLHEFNQFGASSLITRTTNDITQVQTLMIMGLRFLVYAPILCIGGLFMAFSKDVQLSLILLLVLPLMVVVILVLARFVVPLFKSMQIKLDTLNRVIRENLSGIRVIRAFDKQKVETKRFDTANRDLADTAIKVNRMMAVVHPLMMLFMNITSVAIIWFAGVRISNQSMNLGDMMAFLQYAMQIMFSIIMVSFMFVMIPRAEASAQRINEVLAIDPDIKDIEQPLSFLQADGQVAFKNVTFYYPGAEEPALQGISFTANKGQVTAIIGGTGSGKSTLIHMIPRFYDPHSGEIWVDHKPITKVTQAALRDKIGFVPQTAVLFSGTIKDNIRYGYKDATDEAIVTAARRAQAESFILDMNGGYDAVISQGGKNLSGGQKQRLAIARALVRQPEILILDDSFSALDYQTDQKLRSVLKSLAPSTTIILVAQRVSTIVGADQILVLDEGRLVAKGTHQTLLESCSVYQEIVASQATEAVAL